MAAIIVPILALGIIAAILIPMMWSILRGPSRRRIETEERTVKFEDEMRAREEELRDALDTEPFGEPLAGDLWRRLMTEKPGSGAMYDFHRDFCGQALIRTGDGVMLCDSYDGGHNFGDAKITWQTEATFVAFWARQSDYSCSGWEAGEPVFFSDDSWYRNNQRLTRDVLTTYLRGGAS
ncbi:hypothetical protein [Pararhizobium sp.]|uniref:hypothetical protein n=1 Tax=Pararhizobium sp. TaxID=1977563 RepID=UPI002D8115F4|nr:hypothetical protein [Pararhizobium sp.]